MFWLFTLAAGVALCYDMPFLTLGCVFAAIACTEDYTL